MSVRKAIGELEEQTGVLFGMSEHMNLSQRVDFEKRSMTLQEAVEKIAGNNFHYTYYQNFVLFNKRRRGAAVDRTVQAEPIIVDDTQLRKFVDYEQREGDSTLIGRVYIGSRKFTTAAHTFYTPGTAIPDGRIPTPFGTAITEQRSKMAVKTNLLYAGAALTPNLQFEIGLGNRSTLNLAGAYNGWNRKGDENDNKKMVHWLGLAEYRYWLCERFSGHFFGAHALGTHFNVSGHKILSLFDKDYRYEGYGFGVGFSYGYMLPINKRWAAEFNAGVGTIYTSYDKYGCNNCDDLIGKDNKWYFGPTRLGVSLVYIIK